MEKKNRKAFETSTPLYLRIRQARTTSTGQRKTARMLTDWTRIDCGYLTEIDKKKKTCSRKKIEEREGTGREEKGGRDQTAHHNGRRKRAYLEIGHPVVWHLHVNLERGADGMEAQSVHLNGEASGFGAQAASVDRGARGPAEAPRDRSAGGSRNRRRKTRVGREVQGERQKVTNKISQAREEKSSRKNCQQGSASKRGQDREGVAEKDTSEKMDGTVSR